MHRKFERVQYLLLQIRAEDDPMRVQELESFADALHCPQSNIQVHDLISGRPTQAQFDAIDVVLIGGSGDYSVVTGGPWLDEALAAMRDLYEQSKPTFASCWGFQAFARALGGEVVTDLSRAEIGTVEMRLTDAGLRDPVFGPLGRLFEGQMGHQDIVDRLPEGAALLASSDKVENEAFMFRGKPIYGTQFHPELTVEGLLRRLDTYPNYVHVITGMQLEEFINYCRPTPGTSKLMPRFVEHLITDHLPCSLRQQ